MDHFDHLRRLNPIQAGDLRDEALSARARDALEQILVSRDAPRRSRHTRMQWLRRHVLLLVLVLTAVGFAAVAWALTRGATTQLGVGCYATASLEADTIVVSGAGGSPMRACRDVWRRGNFGASASPRLQACVLASGAIGVFPSPDGRACERLQLAPLLVASSGVATKPAPVASLVALKNALVQSFLGRGCKDEGTATAVVRAEPQRLRLIDWGVEVDGQFTRLRPCASLAFDEERRVVILVPMPKRSR